MRNLRIKNGDGLDGSPTTMMDVATGPAGLDVRLAAVEAKLDKLVELLSDRRLSKEYYTTAEAADILGKAELTVREWCRLGRVYAEKRLSGRGRAKEWIIADQELTRIRNEGLLPLD